MRTIARFLALTVAALIGFAPAASCDGGIAQRAGVGCAPVRDDLSAHDLERVLTVTRPTTDFSRPEPFESMPGGAATTPAPPDRRAFSHASANLPFEDEQDFHLGKALFEKLWVSSPSSTQASDGLGPLYNARACESCHVRDGRGRPPEGAVDATSMLFRLARAPRDDAERAEFASHARLNFPDRSMVLSFRTAPCRGLLPRAASTSPIRKNR